MYSPVSKYSPEARKRMTYRATKSKSCGYYMRIVFFFSSLIQSLIIVSLILFLVYGNQHDTASVSRIEDLEMRFNKLNLETVSLRQQRKNLTSLLNATVQEMTRYEYDLTHLRDTVNRSYYFLADMQKKLQQCNDRRIGQNCQTGGTVRDGYICAMQMEACRAQVMMIQSNFTQTAMQMQMEMDQMAKERDNLNLEAIPLRRDKFLHEKAIELYQIKCKDEFINSLSGITNVSKAFLKKIDNVFPTHNTFHLTCPKQRQYLEQIQSNCTNLSEEVVRKFQSYLDDLGDKVSMSQGNISILTAENMRMMIDYNQCSQNRTGLIREHRQNMERIQLKNDEEKEKLLKEKMRLMGEIDVMESSVKFKNSELAHLKEQLRHLNMSCIPRGGGGSYPRSGTQLGSSWENPGSSNSGYSNSGSSNSGYPNSGSSNFGYTNSGSSNSGYPNSGSSSQFNRNSYGSSNSGSSSSLGSSYGSAGSNTGSSNQGYNKPSTGMGSSGLGSSSNSGSGLNKPASSNQGSLFGLGFGSNPSSAGTGLNKQTSTGLGSSSFASSNNPSSSSQNKFGSGAATGASSSNSNLGSSSNSNYGSSSSNQGSLTSKFGSSSNSNSGSSNSGSSNSGYGSSSNSNLGSGSSSGLSKTTSNSRSSLFSSSSASGSSLGSGSSSQNKLSSSSSSSSSSSKSSPSSSSSLSGSSTSANKGFGWSWLGGGSSSSSSSSSTGSSSSSSNSDQSKLGSNQGRGSSNSGTSFGSFGAGRSNSFAYTGTVSFEEHMQNLQRINSPSGQEKRQELTRMMG